MNTDDEPTGSEISAVLHELTTTVNQRVARLEKQLERSTGPNPLGFVPQDAGGRYGGDSLSRGRRASSGMELGPRDSYAEWAAGHGVGRVVDQDEFSIGRLVRAMVAGDRSRLTEIERQAIVEGSDAQGGILIPEEIVPSVIDLVRDATVVVQAGATILPMGSDSAIWASIATGADPEWKAELAPMGESAITFSSLKLIARTLRTKVVFSEEFLEDAPPEAEQAIQRELVAAFALEVDRVALYGSGTAPEPLGLKGWPGVPIEPAVALDSYTPIASAIAKVRGSNHEPTAIVMSAGAAGALDALTAGTDGQPLAPPRSVAAMPTYVTNLAGADVFVGQWDQLVIGARPSLQLRTRQIDSGLAVDFSVSVVAWLRAAVGVVDPTAFDVVQATGVGTFAAQTAQAAPKSAK